MRDPRPRGASNERMKHAWPILVLPALGLLFGCGSSIRRFPLREPMWEDTDQRPVSFSCKPDPKPGKKDPKDHKLCEPDEYESSFAWDAADNTIFRPMSNFFAVDPAGEAVNVNSVDEVPDSSWFTNRIGRHEMSVDELVHGLCGEKVLDPNGKDGSWAIDQGKPNGANPGFRVNVEGVGKFMLKTDPPDQPERATGATSIAARLYYAAGWWAPCDSVVYLRPSLLKLKPGLTVTDNSGITKPFDQAALDKVLKGASHRGELVRMVASRWLPGRTLGPFKYDGIRDDDPNDVIAHEDRRDLRGARVIAAWLNHFDTREQNTMNTWMSVNEKDADSSPGHIRHWYIDLGDCFGSEWEWEGISRRLGHAYYLDIPYVLEDFYTFGLIERPWDRAERHPDGAIFGFFDSKDFNPDKWRGGYPNMAFQRMSEHDAAWAARIIARFTAEHVAAAIKAGDYTDPKHGDFLYRMVRERQIILVRRYLSKLSPVTDLKVAGATMCGVDLARKTGFFDAPSFKYDAKMRSGEDLDTSESVPVATTEAGGVCMTMRHLGVDAGVKDDDPSRYLVIELDNGQAKGRLRAHLYDLGATKGFRLVGVERPDP